MNEKKPFFRINEWYAITLNYDNKLQFFGKPNRDTSIVNVTNERMLTYTQKKIDYVLYLELSEPHKGLPEQQGPRLHFHGYIRFRSKKGLKLWLLNDYRELLRNCIVDIDTIGDIVTWKAYCSKQQDIIDRPPLNNCLLPEDFESAEPL